MQLTSLSLALSRIMGGGAWSPLSLFAAGEQGAWYQPSDLSTLFQDAAGTTPVTGVEQPVGLMLDKSGRGNHAFQATTSPAKRPILSARVNLLTKTEDFSAVIWNRQTSVFIGAKVAAPNGTITADTINWGSAANSTGIYYDVVSGLPTTSPSTKSFYVKADIAGGTVELTDAQVTIGITTLTLSTDWQRIELTEVRPAGTSRPWLRKTASSPATIYVWGADLRPTNIGNNIPAYQRVNTATDYDTAGFPYYLKADGTYTSMTTNSIDFSATDKMTVVSGVRKLSDAATAIIYELSTDKNTNNGVFYALLTSAQDRWYAGSKGTVEAALNSTAGFAAPLSSIVTLTASISTPSAVERVNGIDKLTSSASQGTGNYGNYPLYLFARNNASSFFNGQFYGAIIRGATTSGNDLLSAESYMNNQSGGLY